MGSARVSSSFWPGVVPAGRSGQGGVENVKNAQMFEIAAGDHTFIVHPGGGPSAGGKDNKRPFGSKLRDRMSQLCSP